MYLIYVIKFNIIIYIYIINISNIVILSNYKLYIIIKKSIFNL